MTKTFSTTTTVRNEAYFSLDEIETILTREAGFEGGTVTVEFDESLDYGIKGAKVIHVDTIYGENE